MGRARADVVDVSDALRRTWSVPAPGRAGRLPTFRGVARTGAAWWALGSGERRRVILVAFVLGAIEVGMRVVDLRRLSAMVGAPLASTSAPSAAPVAAGAMAHEQARQWAAATWTLARWPFADTCLRRALLAGFMLRRQHPTLRLGLMPDGATAHAWVEAAGVSYGAADVVEPFVFRVEPVRIRDERRERRGENVGSRK